MTPATRHFLCEVHIPPLLAAKLRSRSFGATHAIDLDLETAADLAIWNHAREAHAIVITKDRDFAELSRRLPGAQVILVQVGNCSNRHLLDRFFAQIEALLHRLDSGERLVVLR